MNVAENKARESNGCITNLLPKPLSSKIWLSMKEMTKYDAIQTILERNGGYVTRDDINKNDIPSAMLYEFVNKHGLIKHATGFYAKADWNKDDYLVFQYLYPKLVYSFYGAQYLNELGDFLPPFLEVTAPKNYRPFPLPREGVVLHTDTKDSTYSLGITEVETMFGNKVRVYDKEKTVCDFIKNRSKIDSESFVKCLHYYKKRRDKNISRLMEYARIMKIEKEVFSLMEVILNED